MPESFSVERASSCPRMAQRVEARMVKQSLFALLWFTRVIHLVSYLNRRNIPIVCYHSVTEIDCDDDLHKLHLPRSLFVEHLDHLKKNYRVISLSEFLSARREGRRLPNYSLVLMFDDGFEDFFTVAADELARRNLPATVFIITDRADGHFAAKDAPPLSWKQVQELAARGFQVGSHTQSHPYLLQLSEIAVQSELEKSRASLLKHLGQYEVPLSYPYGQTSPAIARTAETVGYSCGITGRLGLNNRITDAFELNRTTIASDDDLFTFAARVAGLTWWASLVRQFFSGRSEPLLHPQATIEIDLISSQSNAEEYSN